MSAVWIKNTLVKEGVIDGFKMPSKCIDYFSDAPENMDVEWLNDVGANGYYSCMYGGTTEQIDDFISKIQPALDLALADEEEDGALIALRWDTKKESLIAFISINEYFEHSLAEAGVLVPEVSDQALGNGHLPLQILSAANDNSPEEAFAFVEGLEIEQIEKNKIYVLIRQFATELDPSEI